MSGKTAGSAVLLAARPGPVASMLCGLFGALLPAVTLGLELLTGMCAAIFDPIPTSLHVAAIALVGAANLIGLRVLLGRTVGATGPVWVAHLNAAAIGIALFYSLWFAFLTPIAVVGILFFGLGLLPLSPLLSLGVAWFIRLRLRRRARAAGVVLPAIGLALGAAFGGMVVLEIPGLAQAWGTQAVVSSRVEQQAHGLQVLRQFVGESQLWRSCYGRGDEVRATVHSWLFGRVTVENRQQVYYRVTGRPFNHQPPPARGRTLFGRGAARETAEWVWDDGQGGDAVGQRLKALYLTQSRIDGTIEGDAAIGYLEWTMVFRNDHEFQQREARALVQLPAGAVVSRLTLWINGEEREAAFGGRSQVRQAYQAIVNQRRDPVLVTAKGPDRVLVQCFPVEPKGREMKIRLGISVPLVVDGPDLACFSLPRVVEQNYRVASGLTHAVWIESGQELASALPAYRAENPRHARYALHGELSPAQFASFSSGMSVRRDPALTTSWTRNPLNEQSIVTQELVRRPTDAGPLAIVLDGSGEFGPVGPLLAEALERLPATMPLRLSIAGDTVLTCPAVEPAAVAAWLRAREFAGGQDATMALRMAVDGLGGSGGSVLWLHGTQPVNWQSPAALQKGLTREPGRIRLLALPAIPGPNVLLEKLGESSVLTVLPRLGNLSEDLHRTLDRLQSGGIVAERRIRPVGEKAGTEVSSHLARLWAADEVARLLAGGQGNREAAVALAVKMQLVTALSGAVVLETQAQYDAAGLQPVDPKTTPKVTELGSTLLLLAVGLVMSFTVARWSAGRGQVVNCDTRHSKRGDSVFPC